MLHSVNSKGLTGSNLFKLLFVGYLFSLGPLAVIAGIFSLFDMTSITIGTTQYTGIEGFLGSLVLAFILPFITSLTNWLFLAFGIWLYSKFNFITLIYKGAHDKDDMIIKDN